MNLQTEYPKVVLTLSVDGERKTIPVSSGTYYLGRADYDTIDEVISRFGMNNAYSIYLFKEENGQKKVIDIVKSGNYRRVSRYQFKLIVEDGQIKVEAKQGGKQAYLDGVEFSKDIIRGGQSLSLSVDGTIFEIGMNKREVKPITMTVIYKLDERREVKNVEVVGGDVKKQNAKPLKLEAIENILRKAKDEFIKHEEIYAETASQVIYWIGILKKVNERLYSSGWFVKQTYESYERAFDFILRVLGGRNFKEEGIKENLEIAIGFITALRESSVTLRHYAEV